MLKISFYSNKIVFILQLKICYTEIVLSYIVLLRLKPFLNLKFNLTLDSFYLTSNSNLTLDLSWIYIQTYMLHWKWFFIFKNQKTEIGKNLWFWNEIWNKKRPEIGKWKSKIFSFKTFFSIFIYKLPFFEKISKIFKIFLKIGNWNLV